MTEHRIRHGDVTIFARAEGAGETAPTIVFANSLGSTLSIWDDVVAHLPEGLRIVRFDLRGHGRSDVPPAPYSMGALVGDAEAVCDALKVRDALFVGLSIGGLIGQGLAAKRLDLVRALVLSNTAAKIGTRDMWAERIAAVKGNGLEAIADGIIDRWFSRAYRASDAVHPWRQMLASTDPEGYTGCCAAIAGTDFITPTSGLRLPVMAIAGNEDKSTPPDLVRETAELVPGSRFELIRGTGHLPCIEEPEAYAALLTDFIAATGHMAR